MDSVSKGMSIGPLAPVEKIHIAGAPEYGGPVSSVTPLRSSGVKLSAHPSLPGPLRLIVTRAARAVTPVGMSPAPYDLTPPKLHLPTSPAFCTMTRDLRARIW